MALTSIYHLGAARCSSTGRPVSPSRYYCPSLCWCRGGYWPATFRYIAVPWVGKEEQFPEVCLTLLRYSFCRCDIDGYGWHTYQFESPLLPCDDVALCADSLRCSAL